MERIKAVLKAIQADSARAEEIVEEALNSDRRAFVGGVAAFLAAVLQGVVVDPEEL